MTIVTTKNAPILTALFGLKPRNAMPCDITSKNCIRVSDEWFRLFVGTDANGAEFLAVFTAGESFVLSTLTGASAPSRPRQKRARWAFLIDDLPSDFSVSAPIEY
jgi:hypothetical protein